MQTQFTGKAFVLGDNVDTDQIIPAEYLTYNPSIPAEYRMFGKYALCGVPKAGMGLPKGHLPPKAGVGDVESAILADALRQLDYRERSMAFLAKCPPAILDEVTVRSLSVIDPEAEF